MSDKLTREDVERIVKEAREKGESPNFAGANLYKADLFKADLKEANLFRADLFRADVREANLFRADISGADLTGAKFTGASLFKANFSGADLREANFARVDLREADLSGANLRGTAFIEASLVRVDLYNTIISNLGLRQVKGLKVINHRGPSPISTSTLFKSQGQIPIEFLRGCGLNDWEIENAKLYNPNLSQDQIIDITYTISNMLTGPAIKYNSCFISYSSEDDPFAHKLYDDLQNNGVRCWFAPEDMKIGDKIRHRIDESIRLQDKLLLILSGSSIESVWVESEVERAFALERKRKRPVLFPIRVDDAVMKTDVAWASEIKEMRHIGDFCNWQDNAAYRAGFERLLKDLQV